MYTSTKGGAESLLNGYWQILSLGYCIGDYSEHFNSNFANSCTIDFLSFKNDQIIRKGLEQKGECRQPVNGK